MSDYKPITGELRAAMCEWGWVERDGSIMFTTSPIPTSIDAEQSLVISGSDFDRLCDEIDAIHAELERENAALKAELDRVTGEQEKAIQQALMGEGGVPATDENMAEHGWVRGPIGADGKPMAKEHMVVDDGGDVGVIVETSFNDSNWFVLVDFGEGVSARFVWFLSKSLTHYHEPTVEDVLREFALKVAGEECMTIRTGVVEEYAKKLREVLGE